MAKKKVSIDVRLPTAMIDWLEAQAKIGILGDTKEEVLVYVMRSQLFALHIQQSPVASTD